MNGKSWSEFIGANGGLKSTLERAKRMAQSEDPILISGATGTGKSILAQMIHKSSPRKEAPLIEVPCSSLNDNLIESELFGHVRGAFTGAHQQSCGKLTLAHKGTLFLDEVGELSLNAQCRLLHFLQEGFFYKVGSNHKEYVDVRIIAATNRNLLHMIRQGMFRKDLYFRLAVLKLQLPPLKERGEDIFRITEALLREQSELVQKPLFLSEGVKGIIRRHSWPGNIRELQNVLKRAIICLDPGNSEISYLEIEPLEFELMEDPFNHGIFSPNREEELGEFSSIRLALVKNRGCLNKAAEALGISRYALYRRLKKYGITKNSAMTWFAQEGGEVKVASA